MNDFDLRGRIIVHEMWTEIEKIALQQQQTPGEQARPLAAKSEQEEIADKVEDVDAEDEGTPVSGVFGNKIIQKGNKAKGVPIFSPPEGFQYRPDLQAFAPSDEDSWMSDDQAAAGEATQAAYTKGREDETTERAQQEVNSGVESKIQELQAPPPIEDPQAQALPPNPGQQPGQPRIKQPRVPPVRSA